MAPPDRRPGFSRRAQYGLFASYVLAVAGGVVGAALLAVSALNPALFAAFRLAVAEVTAPVSGVMAAGVRSVAGVPDAIGSWFRVHGENARLRAENAAARRVIGQARVVLRDNARLRRLVRLRELDPGTVAAARIVSTSAASTRRLGVLNAGAWQGVAEGQPVRAADGLVGRVIEVGPNTARVLLVTDPESLVPVRRVRDGLPGIAAGRGDGLVEVRSVNVADARFAAGDLFVTSGTGGIYAPGIPVARVVRPARDTAPARPFAGPDALDFAIVSRAFVPPLPPTPAPTPTPAPAPAP